LQTYFFYDIETTGLNKSFDQVLHFAAIRTDLNLKELERYELKVKLNPDVIPSPYALLTHKMGIKEISSGMSEFDAIKQIHQWLNTPGTISLGYNTLGFDDEFLRFSFYRNLLKPYTHQYSNQCYRMDIYPMTVMFYLFKKDILNWPEKDNKLSLKLENINAANQLISGRAHHAMVDVEVTLELARRFLKEREMWEYLHGYFKKDIDKARLQQAQKNISICVSGKLGNQANYQCPVLFLGNHQHYTNQTNWLRLDTVDLNQVTPETIAEKTFGINKKPGEPGFILPYKERFTQQISTARMELALQNKQWLEENRTILNDITEYYIHYKHPVFKETDIDASLYLNGFWSTSDEFFCQRFHAGDLAAKIKLLKETSNPKLKILATRILGRQHPEMLSQDEALEFADYMQQVTAGVLIDFQGKKRLTPFAAMQEIATIRAEATLDDADAQLLSEFEEYLQKYAVFEKV
jgi:exodeoxyribonuclease-1